MDFGGLTVEWFDLLCTQLCLDEEQATEAGSADEPTRKGSATRKGSGKQRKRSSVIGTGQPMLQVNGASMQMVPVPLFASWPVSLLPFSSPHPPSVQRMQDGSMLLRPTAAALEQ